MKKNMLLIIGLVIMMMFGATGTAKSGPGDPWLEVKDGLPPTSRGSMKRHVVLNRHTIWFYNAEDDYYPDTIDELRVWDRETYQKYIDSGYSDEFKPLLYKRNIPSEGYVETVGSVPSYGVLAWCPGGSNGRLRQCNKWYYSLRVEWSYVNGMTYKKEITVEQYDTVYIYRVNGYR